MANLHFDNFEANLHPGRLTWNLQITHLERKMIFQTSMIVFHVNLPGCIFKERQVIAAGWEDGLVTFTGPAAVNARDDREVHRESRTKMGTDGGMDLQQLKFDEYIIYPPPEL